MTLRNAKFVIHISFLAGWLDNELKISNSFLDDDVDDLGLYFYSFTFIKSVLFPFFHSLEIQNHSFPPGFDPFHETQKGLADLLESEAAEAQQSYKVNFSEISFAKESTFRLLLPNLTGALFPPRHRALGSLLPASTQLNQFTIPLPNI